MGGNFSRLQFVRGKEGGGDEKANRSSAVCASKNYRRAIWKPFRLIETLTRIFIRTNEIRVKRSDYYPVYVQ